MRFALRHVRSAAVAVAAAATLLTASLVASPATASDTPSPGDPAQVMRALDRSTDVPGTAWWVDPATGDVVVAYDDTVTEAERRSLVAATKGYRDIVRFERAPGRFEPFVSGGDPIFSSGGRCTLGFNVRDGAGNEYFTTAGHCTSVAVDWYADPSLTQYLGSRAASSFPGNDYGIVRYASSVPRPGNLNLFDGTYQDITSAGTPTIGQVVCITSSIGGVRCGPVVSLNVTVNYPQGTVYGLGRINICSYPGESGAPVFQGSRAIGLVSGGSGTCETGGVTFYQPITEVLSAYGLSVY